jgi:prepilin-type N-terminal cleavage/methylation domain-containing protein
LFYTLYMQFPLADVKQKGFTLIELLIVIVIIAALAIVAFVALNPVKRIQDAANARRTTDSDSLRNAINDYLVDKGTLPLGLFPGMPETQIGTSNGTGVGAGNVSCVNTIGSCNAVTQSCVDLTTPLASYLKTIPTDPTIGSPSATGYSVSVDANNTVTVNACGTQNSAQMGPPFYGINEHPQWIQAQYMSQLVGYMHAAGIQTVRVDMSWSQIEDTGKGQYNSTYLSRWDSFIQECAKRNIEVLAILIDSPCWAVNNETSPATNSCRVVPPADLSQTGYEGGPGSQNFNDYIGFVMNRWGVNGTAPQGTKWIKNWEVWNEPAGYWAWSEPTGTTSKYGAGKSDPDKYVWLLQGAYKKIKETDPTAEVLGLSLPGANYVDATAVGNINWLDYVYSQGVKNYFDILSAHYYGNSNGQNYATPMDQVLSLHAQYTLPTMAKYGDQNKRVWITEVGVPGWGASGIPTIGVQSEATQAQALTTAFSYAKTQMTNIDRVFWYDFTGNSDGTGTSDQGYFSIVAGNPYPNGLADPWPLKQSYYTLKALPK